MEQSNIEQLLSNLNSIIANRQNVPITGSNELTVDSIIKAFTDLGSKRPFQQYDLFLQMLWSELRYFENLLTFENDEYLEMYGHRIAQQTLFNGTVAIGKDYNDAEKKMMMACVPITVDANGDVATAKGYLTPLFFGQIPPQERDDMYKDKIITQQDFAF